MAWVVPALQAVLVVLEELVRLEVEAELEL